MTVSDFAKNYPEASMVSDVLRSLWEFQSDLGTFYSGDFELSATGASSVLHWFDGDSAMSDQFIIFGIGGDGSLYGFWRYPGIQMRDAPVVFLGSEGDVVLVLANTSMEFLTLLTLGKEGLGYCAVESDLTPEEADESSLEVFRRWAAEHYGITVPEDGRAIVEAAQNAHPDLDAAISEWDGQHFSDLLESG